MKAMKTRQAEETGQKVPNEITLGLCFDPPDEAVPKRSSSSLCLSSKQSLKRMEEESKLYKLKEHFAVTKLKFLVMLFLLSRFVGEIITFTKLISYITCSDFYADNPTVVGIN